MAKKDEIVKKYIINILFGIFFGIILSVVLQAIFIYSNYVGFNWEGINKELFLGKNAIIRDIKYFFTSIWVLNFAILGGFLGFLYKENKKFVYWVILVIIVIYILIVIGWHLFWRVLVGKITEI